MGNDFDGFRDSRPGRSSRPSGRMDTLRGVAPPARGSIAPPDHSPFGASMATPPAATNEARPSASASLGDRRGSRSALFGRRSTTRASVILLCTVGILLGCMVALMSVLSHKGTVASGDRPTSLAIEPTTETHVVVAKARSFKEVPLPAASAPAGGAMHSDKVEPLGDRGRVPSIPASAKHVASRRVHKSEPQKSEPKRLGASPSPAMPRTAEVSGRSF